MSVARALAIAILLAGVIHIIAILALPSLAPATAYARLATLAPDGGPVILARKGPLAPDLDPSFVHALCPFDASNGPVAIRGRMPGSFWFLSLVDQSGRPSESLSSRTMDLGDIDLVIAGEGEIDRLRSAETPPVAGRLYLTPATAKGIILFRAFAESDREREQARLALQGLSCGQPT
ncbi:hypothetical protein HDIA_1330 [Hartmannibacter diazotrophicus]|uniref:DUF1254 domain-containing protein n=1 Tax=Hartmannibacter diazotrophicus TaxID=1482074 RepID=A0A2C9D531_9HYPH|nr:DUF1254 domain-containing protein [Hartmannibacter diazotrophicus]SON54871.1 hypothetical protein HDIA_1330 [Hartmannibacter diazotrophicus]